MKKFTVYYTGGDKYLITNNVSDTAYLFSHLKDVPNLVETTCLYWSIKHAEDRVELFRLNFIKKYSFDTLEELKYDYPEEFV